MKPATCVLAAPDHSRINHAQFSPRATRPKSQVALSKGIDFRKNLCPFALKEIRLELTTMSSTAGKASLIKALRELSVEVLVELPRPTKIEFNDIFFSLEHTEADTFRSFLKLSNLRKEPMAYLHAGSKGEVSRALAATCFF
jgi:hypothetical protein